MKRINKIVSTILVLVATASFTGCSDQFMRDMKSYGSPTAELYNFYEGAKGRVDYLYGELLPKNADVGYNQPSTGQADAWATSTEEYGGLSIFVDGSIWDRTGTGNMPEYIYQENKANSMNSPYGRIRQCNEVIEGLNGGTLPQDQKNELLGQAHFFRAWVYYQLVKIYGGVSIVEHTQNPMVGEDGGLSLVIPRSTTKECIDFICEDLRKAVEDYHLPVSWDDSQWGRVTAGTALALAGRARLLYASPLFNRDDLVARWETAYQTNKSAIEKLEAGGFGLAYANEAGTNASGWAKMFTDTKSPEAVFVTLFNTVAASSSGFEKNNKWEQQMRPANAGGGGGKKATSQMVDLFPMADGLKPSKSLTYSYNPELFFVNRDPRFYRTFAFPGERWAFSGDPREPQKPFPYNGADYVLWSYNWYESAADRDAEDQSGYAADQLKTNNASVYVRKRSDDFDVNASPKYAWNTTDFFALSAAPYMEIRYAEVLLNFAESACGANHPDEAIEALKDIRKRVGYTGNCGFDEGALKADRAKLFAAILYERQIELAYEGKRFDDMRRWFLWDGGVGQEAIAPSFKLTGFGGNTCTYLDVDPLNGTRRTRIEVRAADAIGLAAESDANDPILADRANVTPLDLRTDVTTAADDPSTSTAAIDKLATFYSQKFTRKEIRMDGDPIYKIDFKPEYYIIGFKGNMQSGNTRLEQTIGWPDSQNGGANGTFDPLAE